MIGDRLGKRGQSAYLQKWKKFCERKFTYQKISAKKFEHQTESYHDNVLFITSQIIELPKIAINETITQTFCLISTLN